MTERPILFNGLMVHAILEGRKTQTRRVVKLPKIAVGDRLWVREAFYFQRWLGKPLAQPQPIHYAVDTRPDDVEDYALSPSIHMPRWASRITLEIVGVRVQRVRDISETDAEAEGITPQPSGKFPAQKAFGYLWDSLNKPGRRWADNPLVWVLTFKRVEVRP